MFALHRTLSFAYLKQRWPRTTLIILTIALGVAILVATRALNNSLKTSARNALNPMSGIADLVVVNGQTGMPFGVVEQLEKAKIEGVKDLHALVLSRVAVPELENKTIWLLGVNLTGSDLQDAFKRHGETSQWGADITWTADLAQMWQMWRIKGESSALFTPKLAEALEARSGQKGKYPTCHVRLAGKELTVGQVGTVNLTGEAATLGEHVIFMDVGSAAGLVFPLRPNYISQINVRLEPGANREQVRQRLQEVAGTLVRVQTIEAYDAQMLDVASTLELGFLLSSVGALVVGIFLVYNAMSVSVAERRHDIGILRSTGATRMQISMLFVGEAFLLGLVGALIGLPLGSLFAHLALGPLNQLFSEVFRAMHSSDIDVSRSIMLIALAAGVATSVLAALIPALQASQEEPAHAVRRVPVTARGIYRTLQIGLCVLLAGGGILCALLRDRLPAQFGVFAGITLVFVGVLTAMPLFTALLGRFFRPLFPRLLGLPGRLAADNLMRSPGRTGLVTAALAATTALVIQTAGIIRSTKSALVSWIDDSIAADLFVTSGDTLSRLGQAISMSSDLRKELLELEGVETALPVRFLRAEYRNRMVFIISVDSNAFAGGNQDRVLAQKFRQHQRLREEGAALISENFAALYKVKEGDRITVPGRTGPLELEVVGVVLDYTWNHGTIYLDQKRYQEEFADPHVDVYDVYLKPGADPREVAQAIREKWKHDALEVETRGQFNRELSGQLDRVYGFAYAQQFVVGVVALLGVMSALFISILQRRRELGLLRAVGASRAQIVRSVLAEAALMGLIGGLIGLLLGVLAQWYILDILIFEETGFVFAMKIAWREAALVLGLSVILPILAGIWPALQTTKMRIADAIAYE